MDALTIFLVLITVAFAVCFGPEIFSKHNEAKMRDAHAWAIENNIANRRASAEKEHGEWPIFRQPTTYYVSPTVTKVSTASPFSPEEEDHILHCRRRRQYNDLVARHCKTREGSEYWDPVRGSLLPPIDFKKSPDYKRKPKPKDDWTPPRFLRNAFPDDFPPEPWEPLSKKVVPPPQPVQKYTPEQLLKAADYLKSFRNSMDGKILAIKLNKWNVSRLLALCVELKDILVMILPDARVLAKEATSVEELRCHLDYPLEKLIDLLIQFDKEPSKPTEVIEMSKHALELFTLLGGDVSKIPVPTAANQIPAPAFAPAPQQSAATAATSGKPFSVTIGKHTFSRDPVPAEPVKPEKPADDEWLKNIEKEILKSNGMEEENTGRKKRRAGGDGGRSFRDRTLGSALPY